MGVVQVLVEINKLRKSMKAQPLECSNRAVGVCDNFSNIMCELDEMLLESTDNCNLANFGRRCLQVVSSGDEATPLSTLSEDELEV